ncbi:MAG TPA: NAD(P)/FAD-dependent oxidoreductase [Gemmatimonadaceae bacterium]|nr:NAD(P)/FAD-dependent oxidoreductase [Gemmatimonadaceae bacterium]
MSSSRAVTPRSRPHVVVIGGGFGGLYAARALRNAPVTVTVVDRTNHHLFQPLLYQVATATLSPADIAQPIRFLLRKQRNAAVILAEVDRVDPDARMVHLLHGGTLRYDYLIVAAGARHSYFGNGEWEGLAPGLKTLDDALEIRRRFLVAFEIAEQCTDAAERQAWLTFVVVGGGPTGVELAGIMPDIAKRGMREDFRNADPANIRVVLLEGGARVLPAFGERSSERAHEDLEALGVEVRVNAMVTRIDAKGVHVGEEFLPARTVFWGAGNAASPLARSLGAPLDKAGRVRVNSDLTVPGHTEILVVGDLAAVEQQNGQLVPGVAPAAMQEGRWAARNIIRAVRGEEMRPFRYVNKGDLATIGRERAVAEFANGRLKFGGRLAWLLWLFIHIMYLAGFRNRVIVLMEWAYAYVTYRRGARIIRSGEAGYPAGRT